MKLQLVDLEKEGQELVDLEKEGQELVDLEKEGQELAISLKFEGLTSPVQT